MSDPRFVPLPGRFDPGVAPERAAEQFCAVMQSRRSVRMFSDRSVRQAGKALGIGLGPDVGVQQHLEAHDRDEKKQHDTPREPEPAVFRPRDDQAVTADRKHEAPRKRPIPPIDPAESIIEFLHLCFRH